MHNVMPEKNYAQLSWGGVILGLKPNTTLRAKRMSYFTETRFEAVRISMEGKSDRMPFPGLPGPDVTC